MFLFLILLGLGLPYVGYATPCGPAHPLLELGTHVMRFFFFFLGGDKTHVMSLLDTQEMKLLLLEIEYHESLEDFIKIELKF